MKKGVTLSILVIAVTIMFMLISSATVVGTKALNSASYEEFKSQISRVLDKSNKYIIEEKELPISSYEVVSKGDISYEFATEISNNGDAMNNLYIVDINKLKLSGLALGNGTVDDKEVFLIAEDTNNIYYYKGFKYKNEWHHGL